MSDSEAWLEIVERQVRGLKFGSVRIARGSFGADRDQREDPFRQNLKTDLRYIGYSEATQT